MPYRVWAIALLSATVAGAPAPGATAEGPPMAVAPSPPSPPCGRASVRVGVPFARIGLLQVGMMVGAAALWPSGYDPTRVERNRRQLARSFQQPPEYRGGPVFASDGDWWYFNVFAHGLFGSEAYIAARGLGHGAAAAFLYALFASTTWEFIVEGFFKQPSAVDLVWTPLFGAALGELRYRAIRLVYRRAASPRVQVLLRLLIDPFGVLQQVLLGCEGACVVEVN